MSELYTKVIHGTAGTGKTKRLIDIAEKEIENNIKPEDLVYLSYTRSAANEAKERVSNKLDIPLYKLGDNWRTVHSMCYDLLGLSRSQVISSNNRKNFCEKLDLKYTPDQYRESVWDSNDESLGSGNLIFTAYDWLRSRDEQIVEDDPVVNRLFRLDNLEEDPYRIMKLWEMYKKKNNLVDFNDMLSGVVRMDLKPNANVMIIDEFQDTAPLDYKVFDVWRDNLDKLYIAGDAAQSVYSWRGANPNFLLNMESDGEEVLGTTWRVPSNIWKHTKKIADAMDKINYSDVKTNRKGGEFRIQRSNVDVSELEDKAMDVLYGDAKNVDADIKFDGIQLISSLDDAAQEGKSIMALFRTNECVMDFQRRLSEVGIPFIRLRNKKNDPFEIWTRKMFDLREGIKSLYNGNNITGARKTRIDEMLGESIYNSTKDNVLEDAQSIITSKSQMERDPNDRTLMAKQYPINYYQARAMVNHLEDDSKLDINPYKIKLGTKHSSKGKESDVVVTSFDTSWAIVSSFYGQEEGKFISDEERRVDFVALTRAKEEVIVKESAWKNLPNHTLRILKGGAK